jgi:hypothetical protein
MHTFVYRYLETTDRICSVAVDNKVCVHYDDYTSRAQVVIA